jgi:hypothetical protein
LEESERFPAVLDLALPDGGDGIGPSWGVVCIESGERSLIERRLARPVFGLVVLDEPESLILAQSERWRNA